MTMPVCLVWATRIGPVWGALSLGPETHNPAHPPKRLALGLTFVGTRILAPDAALAYPQYRPCGLPYGGAIAVRPLHNGRGPTSAISSVSFLSDRLGRTELSIASAAMVAVEFQVP
ncbi:hypothetical protein VTK26DRAFT_3 [Humicola hyalothermophila]